MFLTKCYKAVYDILQLDAHKSQLTRTFKDFSKAVYVITNVLLVLLLYNILKIVTRVTETCRCDKNKTV